MRVELLRVEAQGLGCMIGVGLRVPSSGLRVVIFRFGVQGLGLRVEGSGVGLEV